MKIKSTSRTLNKRGETMKRTDEDRIMDLEQKIEQAKAKKQQIERRLKEKERKERTRRLIQVGAIFEKYFDIHSEEEAEQLAWVYKESVQKNIEKVRNVDVEKSKESNEVVYKTEEEKLVIPDVNKNLYKI
jgi:hypothetical protein